MATAMQQRTPIIIHHLGVSQSDRIVWLCEELGLAYQIERYEREPTLRAPAAYRALHPNGTAPVIADGDLVLGESGAIVEYLLGKYGGGRLQVPADSPEFANYVYWLHFAGATLSPATINVMMLQRMADPAYAAAVGYMASRVDGYYAQIEARLGVADYFGGAELTAADIMMVFPLTGMRVFAPRDLAPYPKLRAYLERIGQRPAYQAAMARAEPGAPLPTA